jgi:hypothetical protein
MIAAIIIAPLAWLLLAFGQDASLQAFADHHDDGALNTNDFLRPLLLLAAAGLFLGLIATLRFSPLGAVLTGVVYVGSYVLLLLAPQRVLDALSKDVSIAGLQANAATPLRTGTTVLVGAMLLVALISIGRWRRWPDRDGFDDTTRTWDRPFGDDQRGTAGRDPWEPETPAADRTPVGLLSWASSLRGNPQQATRRRRSFR